MLPGGESCRDDITLADGYTVASVRRNVRFLPLPVLPLRVGEVFSPLALSAAEAQLAGLMDRDALKGQAMPSSALHSPVQVRLFLSCVRVLPTPVCTAAVGDSRCVSVVFSDYALGVDLDSLATYAAEEPRSRYATFSAGVPRLLRLLNPSASVSNDQRAGTIAGGAVSVDLLNAQRLATGKPPTPRAGTLLLAVEGSHALQRPFFDASQRLDAGVQRPLPGRPEFLLHVEHRTSSQPLGTGTDAAAVTSAGMELTLRSTTSGLQTVTAWSGFQSARHTVLPAQPVAVTELSSASALIADGHAHGLLTRNALWFTAAAPSAGGAYRRLALNSTAYRDFAVATNQAIGVELSASYGTSWGPLPAYATFHAGNDGQAFLFDDRQRLLTRFPAGPVIRSLGTQEGVRNGVAGAPSFTGLSATVTIPVRPWSRPLIPDVQVTPFRTLKQLLTKSSLTTAQNLFQASLEKQGVAPEQAEAEAARVIGKDVAPAMHYIAEDANVFSVKPLLAADWAHTYGLPAVAGSGNSPVALGGGLEVALVNTALKMGYAKTLNTEGSSRGGNFFLVLEFRNFF